MPPPPEPAGRAGVEISGVIGVVGGDIVGGDKIGLDEHETISLLMAALKNTGVLDAAQRGGLERQAVIKLAQRLRSALKTLGERESGTVRLEEAVAAYSACLDAADCVWPEAWVREVRHARAAVEAEIARRARAEPLGAETGR